MELGFEFTAMGSDCEIRIVGCEERTLREAADDAIAEIRRIEAKYSRYRGDSVVATINRCAGRGEPVAIDRETAGLLEFADALHHLSGGRFDITSGVLRRCWDFRGRQLPERREVESCLRLIGWTKVDTGPAHVRLPHAGMEVDLGGIGKEYACDRAAAALRARGIHRGWVNLGGDIHVLGPRDDGTAWQFGIRHPRDPGALACSVRLHRGCLATSGDYERFIECEGRRYGHLLDARSGWPSTRWASASTVAPSCTAAGAASTLACLLERDAIAFLKTQGVDWFLVDTTGDEYESEGWRRIRHHEHALETSR